MYYIAFFFLFIVIHQRWTKQALSSFVMVAFYEIYKLAKSCPGVQVQENAKILHFPQIVTIYNSNL